MYGIKLWQALLRYCDDGGIEIDNSAVELCLRDIAPGRLNYLFAGVDSGGERAAAIDWLIGMGTLNGVHHEALLRIMLTHIDDDPVDRFDDLCSWICDQLAALRDLSASQWS